MTAAKLSAFRAGRLLNEIRWHSELAVLSGSRNHAACVHRLVRQLARDLFPAVELGDRQTLWQYGRDLARDWQTYFDSEDFAETRFAAAEAISRDSMVDPNRVRRDLVRVASLDCNGAADRIKQHLPSPEAVTMFDIGFLVDQLVRPLDLIDRIYRAPALPNIDADVSPRTLGEIAAPDVYRNPPRVDEELLANHEIEPGELPPDDELARDLSVLYEDAGLIRPSWLRRESEFGRRTESPEGRRTTHSDLVAALEAALAPTTEDEDSLRPYLACLDLTLNPSCRRAVRHDTEIEFGGKAISFELLRALAEGHPQYHSRDSLKRRVWRDTQPEDNTVTDAISELRSLLPPLGLSIENIPRLGWRLAELSEAAQ